MRKNIVVVTSAVPFYYGGNERLAENLASSLRDYGYNACAFFTPRNQYDSFKRLIGGYIANRFTDLNGFPWKEKIDQVISISYPSYVIKHPLHVCWLAHRMREYYDLWDRWIIRKKGLAKTGTHIQRFLLHRIDNHYLRKIKKLYCISGTVQERLKRWGNFDAEIMHPPPEDDTNYTSLEYKPFIFTVSRLNELKRIHLLIESLQYVEDKKIKVLIAGDGEERGNLEKLVNNHRLEKRVRFLGNIPEKEKHRLLLECRAFYFAPFHEEYGIAAVEAMKHSKPVITSPDSGGPLDFIRDNKNGFIVQPEARLVAKKIDELAINEKLAQKLGKEALKSVSNIKWENVVKRIVL